MTPRSPACATARAMTSTSGVLSTSAMVGAVRPHPASVRRSVSGIAFTRTRVTMPERPLGRRHFYTFGVREFPAGEVVQVVSTEPQESAEVIKAAPGLFGQLIRFALIGGFCALLDYGTYTGERALGMDSSP